jgi:hypothetical protein
MTEEEYLKQRVEEGIKWYSRKSSYNKKMFRQLRIIEIVAAAFIPVLAGFVSKVGRLDYLIAALGLVVVIVAGVISLFRFNETWTNYRTTAESLKNEKYLFITKSDPYHTKEAFSLFVQRIETLISSENKNWFQYQKRKKSEDEEEIE